MPRGIKIAHTPPRAGSVFHHRLRGRQHEMTVVEHDGRLAYVVKGEAYPTPSAASAAITGYPANGWRFWGIKD